MKSNRLSFTKDNLAKIAPPEKAEGQSGGVSKTYYDTKESGLTLLVSNGGAKTFYLYKKVSKQPKRIKLGKFPTMSIENARKKARSYKTMLDEGKDPHEEAQRKKTEGSLRDFFYGQYVERHSKQHNKTWKHDCENFERHLKPLFNKPLSAIKEADISALHRKIGNDSGKYIANRILSLLNAIYNKASDWGWKGENPVSKIKKFPEKSRDRFLQPEELPRFFEALDAETNEIMRDYFYMLLLTGARRRSVGAMRWSDISLRLESWTIQDTKNGETHTVNLPAQALEILHRRAKKKDSEWVFPSDTSKSGHIEEPKSAWKRILKRARIENLRLHDLRRTLGSYQAINGANSYVIGKSLGHKSAASTEVYARLNLDPVKESVSKASDMIFSFRDG